MNIKKFAMGAAALALVACGNQSAAPKKVAIGANTTDDEKFAYMLGAQFGGQNFQVIPQQVGEGLYLDVVVQAIRDNGKVNSDTAAKLQLSNEQLQTVGMDYSNIARKRMESTRPDSATVASFDGDQAKYGAYVDSVSKTLKVVEAPQPTGNAVVVNDSSSNIEKFSYLIGLQFSSQFVAIGNQYGSALDEDYFVLGVKESVKKIGDSTFVMQLGNDSLTAIGQRFQQAMQEKREAAVKKQQEEQAKLEAEVAAMKGDTLLNGMPKLMNYNVKVSGITVKGENLTAFAGKPLFMFYFSATCGHCAHAAPQILEIAKEFSKDGLTTVAVASGGNNKTGIRKFMDNAKWDDTMNVMWDESRQFGELYSDGYVPKVYLVNPDGSYKLYASFESEKDSMKAEIAELLKGKNVEWNPEDPRAKVSDEAKAFTDSVKKASAAPAAPAPAKK
ncbi:MAG: redoxin family protein [Fibrobacter sp.]|nr:redoxin family protein [Fibrobacter sp.]